MEIIKKFKSGKTKIQHDDIVIFVKPYSFGAEYGMVVRCTESDLSESDVKTAYELATGGKANYLQGEGTRWEVREDV